MSFWRSHATFILSQQSSQASLSRPISKSSLTFPSISNICKEGSKLIANLQSCALKKSLRCIIYSSQLIHRFLEFSSSRWERRDMSSKLTAFCGTPGGIPIIFTCRCDSAAIVAHSVSPSTGSQSKIMTSSPCTFHINMIRPCKICTFAIQRIYCIHPPIRKSLRQSILFSAEVVAELST